MAQYHEQLELISFIRENEETFYRIAYSYVKEPETALDLVQDTVVLALQKYHTLRNHDCMKNWFYRILVNQCLGYLRREKRRQLFFKKITATGLCGTARYRKSGNLHRPVCCFRPITPRYENSHYSALF